nr:pyruvate kinase, cytosolic isozyme [Tanacetum cinerariifolium]
TMARICIEAEDVLDYKKVFKRAIETTPMPMCLLDSLACTAVKTATTSKASMILVLTKGGTTAKLVAKYRPSMPILSVVVPEIHPTDSFDWSCSDESPARHGLVFRGLVPILSSECVEATSTESCDKAMELAIEEAKDREICKAGDSVVVLHRASGSSLIKILYVK